MKLPQPESLSIVHFPDPVLKRKAEPLEIFDGDLQAIARRMVELMHRHEGVGLAAPQVALGIRLFVCNPTGQPEDDMVYINPRFLELTGSEEKPEGCLSIPEVTVNMRRATRAVIEACDATGRRFERVGEGLLARIWQHEVDHLDGRLIIDNMSPTDEIANRRHLKYLREKYDA
jgi:peptide deformylase